MVRIYADIPIWLNKRLEEYAEVMEKTRNEVLKDVLIFGLINYIELWDPEIYKSVSNNIMDNEKSII